MLRNIIMAFDVSCSKCGEVYHTDGEHVGRTITCIQCGQPILIQQPPYSQIAPASASKPSTQPNRSTSSWDFGEIYDVGRYITGIITFVVSYIYCIASYGFLFGLGLGWIPSLIVGFIAGFLWPLIAVLIIVLLLLILNVSGK